MYVSPILSRSRKQGIKWEAGVKGSPRQMFRSERALMWTGQTDSAGPGWGPPAWKSDGFILRMRGAPEASTPRAEEPRPAQQKVTPGNKRMFQKDQREAGGKAERLVSRLAEQIRKEKNEGLNWE